MIYNGKKILAVTMAVGIAMSVPAVNGNENETELDNTTMELMLGLNPGEYPITHGSLSQDFTPTINYSSPAITQISDLKIKITPIKQANQAQETKISITAISSIKQIENFIIQILASSTITTPTPINITIPNIFTQNPNSPINIYWETVVMADEISPMERILISIQTAISETSTTIVSIPTETIQAASFIDALTIAIYSPPKIKISDIPIDIYINTTQTAEYMTGIEFHQYTVQKIQEGASLFDIYIETIKTVGEESPISIFWKTQIFKAMSEAIETQTPTIKPIQKTKQIQILSKYDIYGICSDWGSPMSELAKIIMQKRNNGLDTKEEEAIFDDMIRFEIEYTRRMKDLKKTPPTKNDP